MAVIDHFTNLIDSNFIKMSFFFKNFIIRANVIIVKAPQAMIIISTTAIIIMKHIIIMNIILNFIVNFILHVLTFIVYIAIVSFMDFINHSKVMIVEYIIITVAVT